MSNSLFQLNTDTLSEQDLADIRIALDKEASPKIREVELDFDEISDEHMRELVNAVHQTRLASFALAMTTANVKIAQSLVEVVSASKTIERSWLLLGNHHLYYRDNQIGDLNEVLQLGFPKRVTLECQSMTPNQVDELLQIVNRCEIIEELTVNITKMDEAAALTFAEMLRSNRKLKKWSLALNGVSTTYDEEDDLVRQFSGLMSQVQSDLTEASSTAKNYASSFLEQSKTLISAFTAPLTACTQSASAEELAEQRNAALIEEKKALKKYA